jgi:hypothetical protein
VTKEGVNVTVTPQGSYVESGNEVTRYISIPVYGGEGVSVTGYDSVAYSFPTYKSGSVTYTAKTDNVVTDVEKKDSILALTKITFNKGSGHFLCGS